MAEFFFRKVILPLIIWLLFTPALFAQVTIVPDAPGYCLPTEVTLSYTGEWGPGSNWSILFFGVVPIFPSDQPTYQFIPVPIVAPSALVQAFDASGVNYYTDTIELNPALPSRAPQLDTQSPPGDVCEGEFVSATFDPGTRGVECSDEFRYITTTLGVETIYTDYVPGTPIPTGNVEEVRIEARQADCNLNSGCSDSQWLSRAHWNVADDATPPVITDSAADRTLSADLNCELLVPDLTAEVTAVDDCDPSPEITQVPAAGETIGIGSTTVIVTVTNAGGGTDFCTTVLTVIDDTPPVITGCPSNIIISADTSYCGAEVSWTVPVATDNCPGVVLTSNYNPGDFFPLGTNTVTYTATDGAGLNSQCVFDVEVQAPLDPVITGPDPVCTTGIYNYLVTDPGSHSFLWTVINGTILGSSTSSAVDVEWTGTVQGTVSVQITSGIGCIVSNLITVDKNPRPETGVIRSGSSLTRR